MNREEEKMLLQNEKAMMNELRKDLEKEEVPLSVYPSMMKDKLKQNAGQSMEGTTDKTKTKWNFRKRLGFVLGAVVVMLMSGIVFEAVPTNWMPMGDSAPVSKKETLEVEPTKEADGEVEKSAGSEQEKQIEAVESEEKVSVAKSYEQLFEMFKAQGKINDPSEQMLYDYGCVMEDEELAVDVKSSVNTETTTGSSSGSPTNGTAANSGLESAGTSKENVYSGTSRGEGDTSADDVSQTNVQEQGVDEGDIIKTDGEFIYILQENKNAIRVVKANGGDMKECDNYLLSKGTTQEFYVSDGVLTVIIQNNKICYYDENGEALTEEEAKRREELREAYYSNALTDAEDLANINYHTVYKAYTITESLKVNENGTLESLGTVTQDGSYHSSRKVDGVVYLFTQYNTSIYHKSGAVLEEYIPTINGKCIPPECIAIPDNLKSDAYIVCSSFEEEKPDTILQELSVLTNGYNETLYVSENAIYITSTEYDDEFLADCTTYTEITKILYKGGKMTPVGRMFVKGGILNSFSMDEHEGYLRMVTTATVKVERYVKYNENHELIYKSSVEIPDSSLAREYTEMNFLFVVNESMELVGCIEGIAEDESIRSARFMGDVGYFVTYKNVDPLFAVDLSEPTNPQIMDALKIPGFSSYLHFYSNELLFGFGEETDPNTGEFLGLKLSMFDISNPYDVRETNKYVIEDGDEFIGGKMDRVIAYSEALNNHKAMLINPERNIIGFEVDRGSYWDYEEEEWVSTFHYVTFGYGEAGFYNTFSYKGECDRMRGLYIGDILYVCEWDYEQGEELHAFDMSANFKKIGELVLTKERYLDDDQVYCIVR